MTTSKRLLGHDMMRFLVLSAKFRTISPGRPHQPLTRAHPAHIRRVFSRAGPVPARLPYLWRVISQSCALMHGA
jgi:hypothetical protein